jgi:dTDP-4-dehydrorhamnose 3,5-epimerase-like enzyme
MNIKEITPAFQDDRGSISDVFYKDVIEHVAIIDTTATTRVVRGNHYHKLTTQHILVTRGTLKYWYQPLDKSEPVRCIEVPERHLVSTPPLEVHALEILEPNQFIVFSVGLRGGKDYEADTYRVTPILE